MADAGWKRAEREVAALFGSVRTGPVGEMMPDVDLPGLGIEVKYQGKLALKKADLDQAARNAGLRGSEWALVLIERLQPGASRCRRYLITLPETFAAFYHDAMKWRAQQKEEHDGDPPE